MRRAVVLSLFVLIAGSVTFLACTQGEGGRCQINDDCDEGLVCNQVTNTCQTTTGGGIDGSLSPDARGPDGAPMGDAAVDAGVDASVDATSL